MANNIYIMIKMYFHLGVLGLNKYMYLVASLGVIFKKLMIHKSANNNSQE